jgi:hypothetical protein
MAEDGGDRERDAATGAAIGMAARRGLLGKGKGSSAGLGAGLGARGGRQNQGSGNLVTTIIVLLVLFGTLGLMFYMNS